MKRIEEIVKFISPYTVIADVGCDHGYTIALSIEKRLITKAMAIDNKKGPLKKARDNLKKYENCDVYIVFSLSNGINEITDDIEVVIMAGMGGINVIDICKEDLKNVQRLIIQVNRDNYLMRKFICSLGYLISRESIIKDKEKFYEIVVFDKTNEDIKYTDDEYYFGPVLIKEKSDIFINKLNDDLLKLEAIPYKTNETENKIKRILEILGRL